MMIRNNHNRLAYIRINNVMVMLFIIIFYSTATIAKVYKWVDANGNVQYSSKRPVDSEFSTLNIEAENPDKKSKPISKTLNEKLSSSWYGFRDGHQIKLYLSKHGRFRESIVSEIKHMVNLRSKNTYSGKWSLKKNKITFTIEKIGGGARDLEKISHAYINFIDSEKMVLFLSNKKTITFVKYFQRNTNR